MDNRLFAAVTAICLALSHAAAGPLKAVSTTGMIHDAVTRVAADRVEAKALMGPGVDPHLYKPSPGDVRLLQGADAVFYNGLHLEGRMGDLLVRLASKKTVVAVTDRIEESLLREPPEMAGQHDPHVWFDVSLWSKAVARVRDALIEKDSEGAEAYRTNAARYLAELDDLHAWCRAEITRIPERARVLVTAHDAFGYFGRAYGMEVLAIQGVSTDSEAGLRDIARLVDTLTSRRIPAVFVESSVPRKAIDALVEGCRAKGHEVRIGGELFSDAMGAPGTPEGTYIGMVKHNVNTIVAALAPGAPPAGTPPAEPAK